MRLNEEVKDGFCIFFSIFFYFFISFYTYKY